MNSRLEQQRYLIKKKMKIWKKKLTAITMGEINNQQAFQYSLGFSPTIMTTSFQKSSKPEKSTWYYTIASITWFAHMRNLLSTSWILLRGGGGDGGVTKTLIMFCLCHIKQNIFQCPLLWYDRNHIIWPNLMTIELNERDLDYQDSQYEYGR